MLGILIAIAISWLLLRLIEKKTLVVLGMCPVPKRLKQFSIGFLISAVCCILIQYLEAYLKSSDWIFNKAILSQTILHSFWWDFKSVLTEELIFRGALLYILIQKIGSNKSLLISAIAFGVYHWFSLGVIGNVVAMVLIFIGTGVMGYAWALAFYKTKSILLPFGLHLGWNFIHNTIFSQGPLGEMLLIAKGGHELTEWNSLLNFVSGMVIIPFLILIYVTYFVKKENDLNLTVN
ncbi:CPBP family intramembrane glutamic endopeptidase [Winogradskyella bathintestinalis]|uniref:Type II CAAX endopeptidase family protein n=1 Tax=Winogradskyella bathintestinalis TaxID=3035208 RepID=A0ABT7ZTW2_9FLAO|nr:type II CAAX endopeptidase family protein [Winogradskyella bathintestinalis]MDN3492455.1 type II CAAX endopeptidase family protein [Winogradskyella bathintestinalis]